MERFLSWEHPKLGGNSAGGPDFWFLFWSTKGQWGDDGDDDDDDDSKQEG